jgi:hypothetical protein
MKLSNREIAAITKTFLKAQDRLVYQTADLSLASLSGMTAAVAGKKAAIDLEPDFQRRERWTPEKQSTLIESFLLNVPVPPIYLAEDSYGQYSVVDGKQRITAIHAFMSGTLRLRGLESFSQLENLAFEDLPDDLRNALTIRPYVRVVTLLKQSDPSLKFEVFTRLNRGGEPMLPQELRKVAYRGFLSDMIFEVSESVFLKQQLKILTSGSAAYKNMDDAEYVLRFFAVSRTWNNFSGSMRGELDKFMVDNSKLDLTEVNKLKHEFLSALDACEKIWGEFAFKRHTGNDWRGQFLGGVYDAEMISVTLLPPKEIARLVKQREKVIVATAKLFENENFDRAVRQNTNSPKAVELRVGEMLKMLSAV